jgi:hypothetical protein
MTLIRTFPGGTTVEVNNNPQHSYYRVCSASGSVCHFAQNLDGAINFADVLERYYTVSRR